ncbi:MAG: type II secretion system F family protein [Aeromicrobium sp.]
MNSLGLVIFLSFAATGCLLYAVLAAPVQRLPADRRRPADAARRTAAAGIEDWLTRLIERRLRSKGWAPFSVRELELAGIRMPQSSLVILVGSVTFVAFCVGIILHSVILAFVFAILVPLGAKVYVRMCAGRRRDAFAEQLETTMQIMSSALRAGHSFPRALLTVSVEADPPTSEEFARIVNENRLGRDLIEAMTQTAERMGSEDFGWVTDAVAIQRDTGGNLSEVLDRVGTTIRERNELKQQIHALSAEGRISAVVLMSLPVVLAMFYSISNPGYLAPLVNSTLGIMLLSGSAVMYAIGAVWMNALVKVKF